MPHSTKHKDQRPNDQSTQKDKISKTALPLCAKPNNVKSTKARAARYAHTKHTACEFS